MRGTLLTSPHEASHPLHQARRRLGAYGKRHWGYMAYGFILGVLMWTSALRLGIDAIPDLRSPHMLLLGGVLGALAAPTRARGVFGIGGALVCLALLLVMYTPIVPMGIRGLVQEDPLQRAPAVVVLSTDLEDDGHLTNRSLVRISHSFGILRQGYAQELILTKRFAPAPSCIPAVRQSMNELRFDYPISEAGPIENTFMEAAAVAVLARQRGWDRIILVSHPAHMRRAAGAFRKAGLDVICSPCPEGEYNVRALHQPEHRLRAFRDLLHESIGYRIYKLRGWV